MIDAAFDSPMSPSISENAISCEPVLGDRDSSGPFPFRQAGTTHSLGESRLNGVAERLASLDPKLQALNQDRAKARAVYQADIAQARQLYSRSRIEDLNEINDGFDFEGHSSIETRKRIQRFLAEQFQLKGVPTPNTMDLKSCSDAQRSVLSGLVAGTTVCEEVNRRFSDGTMSTASQTAAELSKQLAFLLRCLHQPDSGDTHAPASMVNALCEGVIQFEERHHRGSELQTEWMQLEEGFDTARDHLRSRNENGPESLARSIQYSRSNQVHAEANRLGQQNLSRSVRQTLGSLTSKAPTSLYRTYKGFENGGQMKICRKTNESDKRRVAGLLASVKVELEGRSLDIDSDAPFDLIEQLEPSPANSRLKTEAGALKRQLYRIGIPPQLGTLNQIAEIIDRISVRNDECDIEATVKAKKQFEASVDAALELESINQRLSADDELETSARERLVDQRRRILDSVSEQCDGYGIKPTGTDEERADEFANHVTHERLHRGVYRDEQEHISHLDAKRSDASLLRSAWSRVTWLFTKKSETKHDVAEVVANSIEATEASGEALAPICESSGTAAASEPGAASESITESDSSAVSESAVAGCEIAEAVFGFGDHLKRLVRNWRKKPVSITEIQHDSPKNTIAYCRESVRDQLNQVRNDRAELEDRKPLLARIKSALTFKWLTKKSREKEMVLDAASVARFGTNIGVTTAKLAGATGMAVTATPPVTYCIGSLVALISSVEHAAEYIQDQERIAEMEAGIEKLAERFSEYHPENRDELNSIVTMYKKRRDDKQNLAKAGYLGLTGGGFAMGATAGFLALDGVVVAGLTIAAPVVIGVGATAALSHSAYARSRRYCDDESLKLMQDAMVGRTGERFVENVTTAAAKQGQRVEDYLFLKISERDPRRVAMNLLSSLKREVPPLSDVQIQERIVEGDLDAESIYEDRRTPDQCRLDEMRIQHSPTAQFLLNVAGMSPAQVLSIVDSAYQEDGFGAELIHAFLT